MQHIPFQHNTCVKMIYACMAASLGFVSNTWAQDVTQLETLVFEGQDQAPYLADQVKLTGFQTLQHTPASLTVLGEDLLNDQHAKTLADVIKNDASFGESYAPIGYYHNFMSRGFALDLGSSYLINGQNIRGEQGLALENKQQVEILKGISAIQSGMATPGGVINLVTKRPEEIKTVTVSANQFGQYGIATDIGGFIGADQAFGYRVNLATERLHPYINHVEGERYFGSLAMDWNISPRARLEFDVEAHHQQQKSVPGYQLLDGKVPQNVEWKRLLAYQTWGKPVTMDSINASLNYQYQWNDQWKSNLITAYSQAKLDDYSTFAWGCYDSSCQYTGLGNTFDQQGNYDIYDYQNPDDQYTTAQYKAQLHGKIDTSTLKHHLFLELAHTDKSRKRYGSVNKWIGVGNIYQDTVDFSPTTALVGPRHTALQSQQLSLTAQDRIEWNHQWSTLLGGKWIHLDEQAYNKKSVQTRDTQLDRFLPQLAISYQPTPARTWYVSYAKGLADGRSAAWFAENDDAILAPIRSTQYELGVKQSIQQFLLSATLFDLSQDNQFTKPTETGFIFTQEGKQHSQGLELGIQGALTPRLAISSSAAWTRSRLENTSASSYQGHQTQNTPRLRMSSHLSYDLASVDGLRVLAGGQYSASKYANKTATARVGGYSVFHLGMDYAFKLSQQQANLSFKLDNVLNKKYWRDVGESDGDDYLFLGAPRQASLALHVKF